MPSTSEKKDFPTTFKIITQPGSTHVEVIIQGYNNCYRVEFEQDTVSINETRNDYLGDADPQRYKTHFHPQLQELIEKGIEIFEGLSAIVLSEVYVSINGKPTEIIQPVRQEVLQKLKQLPKFIAQETKTTISPTIKKNESPTLSIVSPRYVMHFVK